MIRPQVKVDDSRWWSLGWQVRQTPRGSLIEHQGGQAGVQAFTSAAVERRAGYVILTNSANGWRIFQDERFRELTDRMLLGT